MIRAPTITCRIPVWLILLILLFILSGNVNGKYSTNRKLGPSSTAVLVQLLPFDVEIRRVVDNNTQVDISKLTDILESWLAVSFENATTGNEYASFNAVFLNALQQQDNDVNAKRNLQSNSNTTTFEVSYEGVTVWTRDDNDTIVPNTTQVAEIQTDAFENDRDGLLKAFQAANSSDLGATIVDVEVSTTFIAAPTPSPILFTKRPTVADGQFVMPSSSPSGAPSSDEDLLFAESSMPSSEATMDESQVPTMLETRPPTSLPTAMATSAASSHGRGLLSVAVWLLVSALLLCS